MRIYKRFEINHWRWREKISVVFNKISRYDYATRRVVLADFIFGINQISAGLISQNEKSSVSNFPNLNLQFMNINLTRCNVEVMFFVSSVVRFMRTQDFHLGVSSIYIGWLYNEIIDVSVLRIYRWCSFFFICRLRPNLQITFLINQPNKKVRLVYESQKL